MCRMMGVVSQGPVYYDLFEEFADLAVKGNTPLGAPDEKGHKDGWGLAFFRNGELVSHVRGEGSAEGDAKYYGAAWKIAKTNIDRKAGQSLIVLGHVRRASPGMPLGVEFAHPFLGKKNGRSWAFAHNGGIKIVTSSDGELKTDSQAVFRELIDRLTGNEPRDVATATRAAVLSLREAHGGYSALNFLLTDGIRLHAFREYTSHPDYYTLYRDNLGEIVVVCSEPILGMKDDPVVKATLVSVGSDLKIVQTPVL